MSAAISVRDLSVSYYDNTVLRNISLEIGEGGLVGVIGPNGAGKTTFIKALLGLLPTDSGEVLLFGQKVQKQRKWIAYVPQRSLIDWDFPINVLDTVLLGTYPHLGLLRKPGRAERELAFACLEEVGMADCSSRQIGELSGGQQQRVFIARALAQRPNLFFLDEPFVGIDAHSEEMIISILRRLRDEGKTVLIVHHDLNKVNDYFDDVLLLNRELIGFGPVEQVFNKDLLAAAFAAQLPLLQQLGVTA